MLGSCFVRLPECPMILAYPRSAVSSTIFAFSDDPMPDLAPSPSTGTTYLTQEKGSRMMGVRDENAPIVACGLEEFSIFAASPNRTGGMDGYFLHLCR